MSRFFVFLETNRVGILLALLCMVVLMAIVQWSLWLFGKGRFASESYHASRGTSMRFIVSEAIVKMVNEFGHIIALIILSIFSFTLIFGIVQTRGNPAAMRETLQTIVSTMGGLVGAVIGYYFNSAVKDGQFSRQSEAPMGKPSQVPPPGEPPP